MCENDDDGISLLQAGRNHFLSLLSPSLLSQSLGLLKRYNLFWQLRSQEATAYETLKEGQKTYIFMIYTLH